MSTFKDSGKAIDQGKYLNAFLYFLIAALLAVCSYFIIENRNLKAENNGLVSNAQAREDKIRADCQVIIDRNVEKCDARFDVLEKEVKELRYQTITDLRADRDKSAALTSESRKALKAIRVESTKTKQASKELDSVSNSLTQ